MVATFWATSGKRLATFVSTFLAALKTVLSNNGHLHVRYLDARYSAIFTLKGLVQRSACLSQDLGVGYSNAIFFNVGPPKEDIFFTTFYGLYFSHLHITYYKLPLRAASMYCFHLLFCTCNGLDVNLNRASIMPKSVLRYELDKGQYFGLETSFTQSCFPK